MARYVWVDEDGTPRQCKFVESLGFVSDIGMRASVVEHDGRERKIVKQAGSWRFWGAKDRVQPLIDHIEREKRAGRTWP